MKRSIALWLSWLLLVAATLVPLAWAQRDGVDPIALSIESVVTVVAVDVVDGQLEPVAAASGTIVDDQGGVLTNHHVLFDNNTGRLHDLFVIGRARPNGEPVFACAGVPAHGELRPELDLARIRCDRDLDGLPWRAGNWPPIPVGESERVEPGTQVWVLGFPNAAGGALRVSAGLVSGWTGEQGGGSGRAFMRTDATVSAGNSGGAAVDRRGHLLGVPTAFRVSNAQGGDPVATLGRIGLIRPVEVARDLLPQATGEKNRAHPVSVTGRVIDDLTGHPVAGAVVMARASAANKAAAWSPTDVDGRFELAALGRGRRYQVTIARPGYASAQGELTVPGDLGHRVWNWRTIPLSAGQLR